MSKVKSIAIIGANGYIARNLVYKLKKSYNDVFNLELYDVQPSHIDNYPNYKQIDLLNIETLDNINYDCDYMFIFSGKTGTSAAFYDYKNFININEIGLLNLLTKYLYYKSSAKIIFPSTRLIYKGISDALLKEEAEKEFLSVYAINKYSAEQYLKLYSKVFNLKYVIFRIPVVYATMVEDASSYGTIGFFLNEAKKGNDINIFGDGAQKRTFVHVDDLCEALIKGAVSNKTDNDVFNIGGLNNISIKEAALAVAKAYKVSIKQVEWPEIAYKTESGDTLFDSSKFDETVNFKYQRNFFKWLLEYKDKND
ncbi:MAG: NAD(P)-dependent oxidoreductase [Bacilli bacterium]|nr:NAD(P)-dependent oxidoreductase [Bacilli bacterium]